MNNLKNKENWKQSFDAVAKIATRQINYWSWFYISAVVTTKIAITVIELLEKKADE